MKDFEELTSVFSDLRRRAEEHLLSEAFVLEELPSMEAARLIHELQVHQIELEMQNEELRQTQLRLEESRSKYVYLYDFAPVAYLTLNERGQIREANFAAATLLGEERQRLLGLYFTFFVVERQAFRQLLNNSRHRREERKQLHIRNRKGRLHIVLLDIAFLLDVEGRECHHLIMTDISKLKQAQDALEQAQEKLRLLARQLLITQELERQIIARDLHDEMGQSLIALKFRLDAVKKSLRRGEEAWGEFERAIDFIDIIADQVRDISRALRPAAIENLGLNGALIQMLDEFQKYHGIALNHDVDDVNGLFSVETQIAVFRIIQECLTNAAKHSMATSATLLVKKKGEVVSIIFEDNGVGVDWGEVRPKGDGEQGLGLSIMRERIHMLQGFFQISSARDRGTRIAFALRPDKKPAIMPPAS